MTRVLLINPPQTYYERSQGFSVYLPLGILSLAAVVCDICDVEIYDALERDFEIRRNNGITRYGAPELKIEEAIRRSHPDIVGVSIPFTAQAENGKRIGAICREIDPGIIVVFGGPDPSVRYPALLESGLCDYCAAGEGEDTFREVVERVNAGESLCGIPGLAYRDDEGAVRYTPREFIRDLDRLPFPAYDLVNMEGYLSNPRLYQNRSRIHRRSLSIITSRGCPYSCVFCSIRLHMGRRYRAHSPEYVLRHIELAIKRFGVRSIHFEDDNISLDRERFEKILDGIIERNFHIRWDTPNGIRADSLNLEILKKIKASGCAQLTIAIESGNQEVLNRIIKKNTSLSVMKEIARFCHELDIRTNGFYVIGFPGETLGNMRETIDLALTLLRECDIQPNLFVATPLYGTELHEICVRDGLIGGELSSEELATATQVFGNPLIETADFTKEDVIGLLEEYRARLKRELIGFSLRHPFYALNRARERVPLIMKLFGGSRKPFA
jgi:anaerobic magnesium-protoporphyrin IX monomethyl ester cyclase